MKYTYEIVTSYSGTINTGNYENQNAFHSTKCIVETDKKLTEKQLLKEHCDLQNINRASFLCDKVVVDEMVTTEKPQQYKVVSYYPTKEENERVRTMNIISAISQCTTLEEVEEAREWANKIVTAKRGKFQSKVNLKEIKDEIERKKGELNA